MPDGSIADALSTWIRNRQGKASDPDALRYLDISCFFLSRDSFNLLGARCAPYLAWVFITNGPYCAMGSLMSFPATILLGFVPNVINLSANSLMTGIIIS